VANEAYVLDSSVAAKWFLRDENGLPLADELLARLLSEDLKLYAPHVMPYEVGHALRRAALAQQGIPPRMSLSAAIDSLGDLVSLPIQYVSLTGTVARRAMELALKFKYRFYDMAYVALAENMRLRWCTSDEGYASPPPGFPVQCVAQLSEVAGH